MLQGNMHAWLNLPFFVQIVLMRYSWFRMFAMFVVSALVDGRWCILYLVDKTVALIVALIVASIMSSL
jgi:hypothetical protein